MDKYQALHSFWSSFGLTAYDEASVPSGENAPPFPYITYGVATDSLDAPVLLNASLWYRSSSWEAVSKKTEQIAQVVEQHPTIPLDVGYLFLTKGTPFAHRMSDPDDNFIRRVNLLVMAEYLTPY